MIYVFGGCNLDLNIRINGDIKFHESNPSKIDIKYGGVGRNIARSISNFKPCTFITAVSNRIEYLNILDDLKRNGINTDYSIVLDSSYSSIYANILVDDDLYLGACDTNAVENIKLNDIDYVLSIIKEDDIVVVDANFTKEFINHVLDNAKGIKIFDGVSSPKLAKVMDTLYKFDYIKVNKYEYDLIKGLNLSNLIITNGSGVEIIKDDLRLSVSHKVSNAVNTTGCGDSFFGAFIANIDKGIKEAVECGIISAIASSLTNENVPTKEELMKINKEDYDIIWKD